jgi:hypothetical protein
MMFEIGHRVVCVKDNPEPDEPAPFLAIGTIYTVSGFEDWEGEIMLLLAEMAIHNVPHWSQGYAQECFRPVVENKTDISVFTAILKPEKTPALALQESKTP